MASNLVVSEFLCFTLNKVGKSPAKNVKAVLLDFYNEDEIWSAKALLHSELSKLTSDELPRLVHRNGRATIEHGLMWMTCSLYLHVLMN